MDFFLLFRILWSMRPYLIAINGIEISLFLYDKSQSISGRWRVKERTLLLIAFAGGTPGAFLACRVFRHKNRKRQFMNRLFAIAFLQGLALLAYLLHRD